jgi:hypothetical protein
MQEDYRRGCAGAGSSLVTLVVDEMTFVVDEKLTFSQQLTKSWLLVNSWRKVDFWSTRVVDEYLTNSWLFVNCWPKVNSCQQLTKSQLFVNSRKINFFGWHLSWPKVNYSSTKRFLNTIKLCHRRVSNSGQPNYPKIWEKKEKMLTVGIEPAFSQLYTVLYTLRHKGLNEKNR